MEIFVCQTGLLRELAHLSMSHPAGGKKGFWSERLAGSGFISLRGISNETLGQQMLGDLCLKLLW